MKNWLILLVISIFKAPLIVAQVPITTYSEIYFSAIRFDSAIAVKTQPEYSGVSYTIPPNSSMVIRTYPAPYPLSGTRTDTVIYQSPQTADSLYELIKSRYVGKKFVFSPSILFPGKPCKPNINSPITGLVWTVSSVVRLAYDKTSNLDIPRPLGYETLVCKSTNGDCATVDLIYFSEQNRERIYTPDMAVKLKAKYGVTFWNAILSGTVKLGMNQEMCLRCWGKPSSTNITHSVKGDIEDWTFYYPNHVQYLYFTNGILTAYQD